MLELELSGQFRRDLKKIQKRHKDRNMLDSVIEDLQYERALLPKFKDHQLTGNWVGFRECHITSDWLLIYKILKNDRIQVLRLVRTGSHSDLFG